VATLQATNARHLFGGPLNGQSVGVTQKLRGDEGGHEGVAECRCLFARYVCVPGGERRLAGETLAGLRAGRERRARAAAAVRRRGLPKGLARWPSGLRPRDLPSTVTSVTIWIMKVLLYHYRALDSNDWTPVIGVPWPPGSELKEEQTLSEENPSGFSCC